MPPPDIPKPTKKKIRPSSASANLQSHETFRSSLFDKKRPTTAAPTLDRSKSGVPKAHHWRGDAETQELVNIKLQRRPTLSTLQGLDEADILRVGPAASASAGDLLKSKIEEKISIDTLELLKKAFQEADEDGSGELDLDEFKLLLKSKLNFSGAKDQQIDALFYKIDWSSDGNITWDEFCTYMQLEYAEKEDSYLRSKDVSFNLPAKAVNTPHRDSMLKITDTPEGTFIACSQEGLVSFWDAGLRLKRTRTVVPVDPLRQTRQKWITDFTIMAQYNKIIVGTGDREIQFFELSSFEPYCQINLLSTVPLHMDCCSTNVDECLIMYGDAEGCVNIIVMKSTGESLRTWKKKPKQNGIATVSLDDVLRNSSNALEFISWQAHGDWVQDLKYYHDIRQIVSCSNHTNTALVIGCTIGSTNVEGVMKEMKEAAVNQTRTADSKVAIVRKAETAGTVPPATANNGANVPAAGQVSPPSIAPRQRLDADQTVFKVYKGVKTFTFSKSKNVIVTGGMDRIVRMWNPYVPGKPTGLLRGHNAPIFYLFIAEEEDRIFSISTDKLVKIWDIHDQNCLLTVRPKGHKIRGDLQACYYSGNNKSLAVATDQMALLNLKLKPIVQTDIVITHKEPVTCLKYNPGFKQVVTCSEGSVVKLWDFETGNAIFEYGEAHGDVAITCMDFDTGGRRLLTGGRDGTIKVWNYNNGHCLMTMMKATNTRGQGNEEVCSLVYIEMNKNRYVVGVGWDRCVNIYLDEPNDTGVHQIVDPQEQWDDDVKNGHKEDILSIAYCPPNLLATSSYEGEVIVWNMVSGHIFTHLWSKETDDAGDEKVDGDCCINKVLFLSNRTYKKDSAALISSGPRGCIHFWNIFQGGSLYAKFRGTKVQGAMVTTMKLNQGCTVLFSADSHGFIFCWNVETYALHGAESSAPELLNTWRAHVESITALEVIDENKLVISASADCSARLWTKDGDYIGTFGQPESWDVHNPSTWQHPMAPFDVLVDPLSLPSHPVIDGQKENAYSIIHEDSARNSDDEEKEAPVKEVATLQAVTRQHLSSMDDDGIANLVKERAYARGKIGKRLRHEKFMPPKVDRGGPSDYQLLHTYELESEPQIDRPEIKGSNDDHYDLYATEDGDPKA